VGIIGPNGGGKTTLLKLMLGLLTPSAGSVRLFGGAPAATRHRAGYVPQFIEVDRRFPITVRDVVLMGLAGSRTWFPRASSSDHSAAMEALASVGMEPLAGRRFGELSGGQRQRCIIARAIASRPDVLFLDEPTASVDLTLESGLFDLLHRLNDVMTIVLVTHDLGFISDHVTRVACINHRMVTHAAGDVTVASAVQNLYPGGALQVRHHCHI
jgi:zinc transport system ATP-binding protein